MMAHWLLRRRMAEHDDDGHARRQDEQQPEQNESKEQVRGREDRFEREALDAAHRVRPRESSAK